MWLKKAGLLILTSVAITSIGGAMEKRPDIDLVLGYDFLMPDPEYDFFMLDSSGAATEKLGSYIRDLSASALLNLKKELENGIDPNCCTGWNKSPLLIEAIIVKNYEAIKLLLAYGANSNTYAHGYTPLHELLSSENFSFTNEAQCILNILLFFGADPSLKVQESALLEAKFWNKSAIDLAREKGLIDAACLMETYNGQVPALITACKRAIIRNKNEFNKESFAILPSELAALLPIKELFDTDQVKSSEEKN